MGSRIIIASFISLCFLFLLSESAFSMQLADSTDVDVEISADTVQNTVLPGILIESKAAKKFISVFNKSPLFIIILYIVIIYSIITLISLTVIILIKRARMNREQKLRDELNEKYQQLLIDYLFSVEENEELFKSINKIATSDFRRQILINQLMELSATVQGEMKESIKELFLKLGLAKDSLRKAYSKKWHENIKGFRELAFMNIRDANERILECLNSPNEILRMEAQISLVRLSDDNPYSFLDHLRKPLAIWEQITLHELVIQNNLNTPDFSRWFKLENLSIVIFCLQMVSWFKQTEAVDEVIKLLYHEDEDVRRQAVEVCGDLALVKALPDLQKIYDDENYMIKMEILKSFGRTPDDNYLEFLNEVLDKEEDVQLQISATKAMENLGENGISRLIKLMKRKSEFKNYQIIIRHVLDGRIY